MPQPAATTATTATATAVTATTAASTPAAFRHDGWTPERQARFLDHLAGAGNVRAACACAGMSAEAAYRLRRRDHLFARGWAAALVLAREASAEVLATRAIDGVEEEIYYRGELVGARRRFDTRLLLAHMARLDRLAESSEAGEDAARFDQLLAAIACVAHPADLAGADGAMAVGREAFAEKAARGAESATRRAMLDAYDDEADGECEEDEYEPDEDDRRAQAYDEMEERCEEAAARARAEAIGRWDEWLTNACARLDAMTGAQGPAGPEARAKAQVCTPSSVSTSAPANPLHISYARA